MNVVAWYSIGVAPQAVVLYLKSVLFLGLSFHFLVRCAKRSERDGSDSVSDKKKRSLTHFSRL